MSKIENAIFIEDCKKTMRRMMKHGVKCDIVLTSPPYNTSRSKGKLNALVDWTNRYDVCFDYKTEREYLDWVNGLFDDFDKILVENGVILWNVSYGGDTTQNTSGLGAMFLSIAEIMTHTNFTVADRITWKKKSAMPNVCSPNKLTRIVEDIYVFVRKNEIKTFHANKKVVSQRENGQKMYENIYNFIEDKNNDGANKLNKATFSTELVTKLLCLYARPDSLIYDPFMGTGTTAVSAFTNGHRYIGSEISQAQVMFSQERSCNTLNI